MNEGMLNSSLQTYAANPFFLIKKMFMNAIGFWMLSETTKKSVIAGLMHVPLPRGFRHRLVLANSKPENHPGARHCRSW